MLASLGIALALHLLSVVVWVGGMFFAYQCLRPAVADLPAAERTALWGRVLGQFFRWVLIAVPLILASGIWMIVAEGGMAKVGMQVHLMLLLGLCMMLLFLHVYFAPFRRLRRAVAAGDTLQASTQVGAIRRLVGVNLILGIVVVLIATIGKYLSF
jgi:uncharacterized membrane protein